MQGTLYGTPNTARHRLYTSVTSRADSLRGQLEALARAGYGSDSEDVEAVRGAIFAAHGWPTASAAE